MTPRRHACYPWRRQNGSFPGAVAIRDVVTGRVLRSFGAHDDEITSLSFAPDGRMITSGCDQTAKLFDRAVAGEDTPPGAEPDK